VGSSDAHIPADVVAGVKAGDPDSVATVYGLLAAQLLRYLIARVGDAATAEDLLELTFTELLVRGSTITGDSASLRCWLYRAAHCNALDHLRRRQRQREREDLLPDLQRFDLPDTQAGPAEVAEATEVATALRLAMGALSVDQRQVLALRYLVGMSGPEVAEVLGKSDGAVRSLQHRGERSLARVLSASA
jgi:RNA polymerase sigma-70 factor, ECF subfamily